MGKGKKDGKIDVWLMHTYTHMCPHTKDTHQGEGHMRKGVESEDVGGRGNREILPRSLQQELTPPMP